MDEASKARIIVELTTGLAFDGRKVVITCSSEADARRLYNALKTAAVPK